MMLDFSQKFSRIKSHKAQLGQVLAEILIAVVIAGIIIGGVAGTIGTSLITSKKTRQITAATGLAQEGIEAAKAVAESSWLSIYCPPSGTCPVNKVGNHYKAVLSGGSWQIQSGDATSTIDALTYTHYFYIENVNRDAGGDIKTDGTEDPSTQKITAMVTWSGETNFTMAQYLMRTTSSYFRDFNWSSGNLGEGSYTISPGFYSTSSSSILIANSSIQLTPYVAGYLESSTFDTGFTNGVAFVNILWKGTLSSTSHVRFRLASSNSSTSTWTFLGPNGTETTYYEASDSNISMPITTIYHNNHRYFRYRIYLYPTSDNLQSPTVTDVIIGYSP